MSAPIAELPRTDMAWLIFEVGRLTERLERALADSARNRDVLERLQERVRELQKARS